MLRGTPPTHPQAPAAESTLAVAAAARAIAYPGKQSAADGAEGRGELLSFAPHARPFDERVKVFRQARTRARARAPVPAPLIRGSFISGE
jgi:hypothetical protein